MGAGGVPNRSVIIVKGRSGDLPTSGAVPNSRMDLYVHGVKIQSRWFDFEGKVVRNRDYIHQDRHHSHYFPHDHVWYWIGDEAYREPEFIEPDYEYYN